MTASTLLVTALKAELRRSGLTYADLARELGMAESSIKRIFAKGDMPLSRVDAVLGALKMDFTDLARQIAQAQAQVPRRELTLAQERAVVRDRKLLLVAISVMSQWTFEQIVATYTLSDAECVRHLVQLDRLGVIELRPLNRYRLKVDKTFRWRPDGPVMNYFRAHVVADYFGAGFDGEGETLLLVHGEIGINTAQAFAERLHKLGQDFAQQHLSDQRLPTDKKCAYTLVAGMRSWLFAAFRDLKRDLDRGAAA
jgi:transcriptional regulator with XRE-family HTH domain